MAIETLLCPWCEGPRVKASWERWRTTRDADHTRVKQSEIDTPFATFASRRGSPQRLSAPSSSFVCLRGSLFFRLFQASRAPDEGADHTRKKLPIVFKDPPRMDTNRDGPPSITNRARMYLRYRDLDIPTSWAGAHPGARASRPQPYSCKQPAIQGYSLEQCAKPAFAGFATMVPSPMRARRPRSRVGVLPFSVLLFLCSCAFCGHPRQRSRCRILQKAHPCVGLCVTCAHRHLLPPPTRLDTHRRRFPWADAHG